MWRWLKKLFVRDKEILEKLACQDIKITNLGKLNGSMAGVIALLQRMEKDNQMAVQAILDKVAALDTKEDAVLAVLAEIKTDVDALKALVQGGNLQAVSDAIDALGAKVDAVGVAAGDVKTDAEG